MNRETQQSLDQQLEQARLNFVSDLHDIINDVVKGKEDIIKALLDAKHMELFQTPQTITKTFTDNGVHAIDAPDFVSVLLATDSSSIVTINIDGESIPFLISSGSPIKISKGNQIMAITVKNLPRGNRVFAKLYNEKASTYNESLGGGNRVSLVPQTLLPSPAPLAASGTYTSNTLAMGSYEKIVGSVYADQTGTLNVNQSYDGENWDVQSTVTVSASTPTGFNIAVVAPYQQIVYSNGSTAQSTFRLHVGGKTL